MSFVLAIAISVIPVSLHSSSAACKLVQPTGKTVGKVIVGNVNMPIKAFSYPAGGVMEPQRTTLAAGLSKRHMPLSSSVGSSVLTWHVNYGGCQHPLNVLMARSEGYILTIIDENGDLTDYRIDKKFIVKKGNYKKSWFNLVGPRQLVLFTCAGEFEDGHYVENMVFIATPV